MTFRFDKDKMDKLTGIVDSSEYDEKYEVEITKHSRFWPRKLGLAAAQSGYDFSGVDLKMIVKLYSLAYSEFVVPLVKAIQEQQAMIENSRLK